MVCKRKNQLNLSHIGRDVIFKSAINSKEYAAMFLGYSERIGKTFKNNIQIKAYEDYPLGNGKTCIKPSQIIKII